MPRRTLNLGIVAHVDAGKTTLTERLLYAAGVIGEVGSVDAGTTQTDSLELERRRGITIRSAVASFPIEDVSVNLIDTPGHPDFIAEVERVLGVLDGVVLVVSAVEGVQPQTRVLMRALRRLRVATLLFVNKIDRPGATYERVLEAISGRLGVTAVPLGAVARLGTPTARFTPWGAGDAAFRARLLEALSAADESLLAAYVEDEAAVPYRRLRRELARQTRQARVCPVFFGSAVTGAGMSALTAGLVELLPAEAGDVDGQVSGRVFKIERGPAGEKVAYVRMFSGTVRPRDRVRFGGGSSGGDSAGGDSTGGDSSGGDSAGGVEEKVTAIRVFDSGAATRPGPVSAGEIGKLWGVRRVRVGDVVGRLDAAIERGNFAPPAWETVVEACDPAARGALRVALGQLAEQDPLINVRQDDSSEQIRVSLYGEVQKQVIEATLAHDFGVEVRFRDITTICVERPVGTGAAVEILNAPSNPFLATMGLRIEPAPEGSEVEFRLDVDVRTVPMYVYKSMGAFIDSMGGYVRRALREDLSRWEVTDCVVTMFECDYASPSSTAADFRRLTPLVLGQALRRAGTVVCQPILRVHLEVPTGTTGAVLSALARLGALVERQSSHGDMSTVDAMLPAARVQELQRRLAGLTGGEGALESSFGGYQSTAFQ